MHSLKHINILKYSATGPLSKLVFHGVMFLEPLLNLKSPANISSTHVIKNFSPAFFAAVMGTGIFGITSKYYSCYWSWLNYVSTTLLIINVVGFLIILVPWILRWFLFRGDALKDLGHPVAGQFYATLPIGCLVLAAQLLVFQESYPAALFLLIAKYLWISGALLAFISALIIPIVNFSKDISVEDINPTWFMPPVSLIVIPIAGAKIVNYWPHSIQKLMLILNYTAWGSGFFLFMFLAAICLCRFFVAPRLPGFLVPTVWIYLGPIGAGTIALLNLASASNPILGDQAIEIIKLFGLIYWGFGFWWLMAASIITITNILKKNLPYALSWWAFTFPLGAYTGATFLISSYYQCDAIRLYGFFCYLLLAVCWLTVFIKTIDRVCTGELFKD